MVQSSNSIRRYAVNLALHFSVTQSLSEVSVIYFCIFHLEDVCCILYFLNTHYALFLLFAFHSISGRLSLLCTSESFLILSQVHSQSLWMDIQVASSNSTEVINLIQMSFYTYASLLWEESLAVKLLGQIVYIFVIGLTVFKLLSIQNVCVQYGKKINRFYLHCSWYKHD